jgi:hypothetical protein
VGLEDLRDLGEVRADRVVARAILPERPNTALADLQVRNAVTG